MNTYQTNGLNNVLTSFDIQGCIVPNVTQIIFSSQTGETYTIASANSISITLMGNYTGSNNSSATGNAAKEILMVQISPVFITSNNYNISTIAQLQWQGTT